MYTSGQWEGFWEQELHGRQPMREFELIFRDGEVTGRGTDMIGRFTFAGAYDTHTGQILMVKRYIGRHSVRYAGGPDGEGCIQGTWEITQGVFTWTGPFRLRPVLCKPGGDEPIQELK